MMEPSNFKQRKSTIAATAIMAGCILYIICSIADRVSFDDHRHSIDHHVNRRFLRSTLNEYSEPGLAVNGHIYKLHGDFLRQQVTWYKVLSSRRLQLNMAPYRWKSCKKQVDRSRRLLGEHDMYMGDAGFTFHVSDPQDPSKVLQSKYLRFRLEQKNDRSCMWNYSKTCLAGGNFVMKFGKTARDVRQPGKYTLKTTDGPIRIMAYNTNRACSRRWQDQVDPAVGSDKMVDTLLKGNSTVLSPIDYIRQAKSSTLDHHEACGSWLNERESSEDLFSYNSDLSTIQIETPWMSVIIQVDQSKVATESTCRYAKMNIWITSVNPEFAFSEGIQFSEPQLLEASPRDTDESIATARALSNTEAKHVNARVVNGPFAE